MELVPVKYDRHIFVCVNERESGDSCAKRDSENILRILRDHVNSKSLYNRYNITKSRCLGHCAFGPTVAIYPDGLIFRKISLDDAKKIIEEFLQ